MYDSPYDSEEEVDAWFAQEVAIEHEDFVDEILGESPEAIQTRTDTSLANRQDSNAISGGGSNANSGGGSGTVDSNANSGGGSNANSGGQSEANTSGPAVLEVRDPPARKASSTAVVYDRYTRDAIHSYRQYEEAAARVTLLEQEAIAKLIVKQLQALFEDDQLHPLVFLTRLVSLKPYN
jgi:hypothetical protein